MLFVVAEKVLPNILIFNSAFMEAGAVTDKHVVSIMVQ